VGFTSGVQRGQSVGAVTGTVSAERRKHSYNTETLHGQKNHATAARDHLIISQGGDLIISVHNRTNVVAN
jgi:hypothetical protein